MDILLSDGPEWMWLEPVEGTIDEVADGALERVHDARLADEYVAVSDPVVSERIERIANLEEGARLLEWFAVHFKEWMRRRVGKDAGWEELPLSIGTCDSIVLGEYFAGSPARVRTSRAVGQACVVGDVREHIAQWAARWGVGGQTIERMIVGVARAMKAEAERVTSELPMGRGVRDALEAQRELVQATDAEYGWTSHVWRQLTDVVRDENRDILLARIEKLDVQSVWARSSEIAKSVPLGMRRWGSELEIVFELPLSGKGKALVAESLLKKLGLGVGSKSEGYQSWKVVQDGSVKSGHRWETDQGLEIVSRVLEGEPGAREYAAVLLALSDVGGRVNQTCGAHFHVEALDFSGNGALERQRVRRLVLQYAYNEERLDAWVAPSRREGKYRGVPLVGPDGFEGLAKTLLEAPVVTEGAWVEPVLAERDKWAKESKINFMHLYEGGHGTVEFRQLEGVMDPRRGLAWLRGMMAMMDQAAQVGDTLLRLEGPELTGRRVAMASVLGSSNELSLTAGPKEAR